MASENGRYTEVNRVLEDYLTIPGTQIYYHCPTPNWAFDYTYDETQPSFYFTKNVNNVTITCDEEG
jgi:hypothetical protein